MIYYICGIRRSGLHAIANWLFPMMGEYIYLNNYELGKLSDKELVINGSFNVIVGIESKPLSQVIRYCKNGTRIWVRRSLTDVLNSQYEHYNAMLEYKLGESVILNQQYKDIPKRDLVIEYEKWNETEIYRKLIADKLGLEFNDSNKKKVFGYGKSSYA